jgi:flagellar hook-associated protein 2
MAEVTSSTESSYDYSSIGSVGGDATQSLNGEIINKIRAAEEEAVLDPITEDIDNIALEQEKIDEIKSKLTDFIDITSYFDISDSDNVFNQFLFDTTGDSAVFDVTDKSTLTEGSYSVHVDQLAQRDVFQSVTIADTSADVESGILSIQIGTGDALTFDTTAGVSYENLALMINQTEGLDASIEQVGDAEYRLVVKSTETGNSNSLTFSGLDTLGFNSTTDTKFISEITTTAFGDGEVSGSIDINGVTFDNGGSNYSSIDDFITDVNNHADFNASVVNGRIEITRTDGTSVTIANNTLSDGAGTSLTFAEENTSQVLQAQDFMGVIDGIEYERSSNSVTIQNSLKITAIQVDDEGESSTVTVSKDNSAIQVALESMILYYNDLVETIDTELNSTDSVIEDKSSLRTMMSDLKNILFTTYSDDKSAFLFGIELDKYGNLSLDESTLDDILNGVDENYTVDDLKEVFTGTIESEGIGVLLKDYMTDLTRYEGLLYNYENNMDSRLEDLEEDKEKAIERLDTKYDIMAKQFSAYGALIAQMEASFSSLKMMIAQSTASS